MPIVVTTPLTVTPEPRHSPPRVRIQVSGATNAADVVITRTGPDNRAVVVRTAGPLPLSSGQGLVYDHEAPFGVRVTYTATTRTSAAATIATSSASTSVDVMVPWLIHPGVPSLSMPLRSIKTFGTRVRAVNAGVFQPYGRSTPIVVTDGRRKAPTGQVELRTQTLDELTALIAILDDTATLLVNIPATLGWGVTSEYWHIGDLSEAREVEVGADSYRAITAPYLVVAAPEGGSQGQRTWADVLAQNTTWQGVLDRYPTWLDLLAPTTGA